MYPAALSIVLIGMVLGIGLFVLAETREGIATDYTGLDVDQTMNGTNGDGLNVTTLSAASGTNYVLVAEPVIVESLTNTALVNGVNFTYTTAGVITVNDTTAVSLLKMNISSTYNYDATDKPETAMTTSLTGIGDFADWIAIIVVVIAAAIILGVVLSSFGRKPGI